MRKIQKVVLTIAAMIAVSVFGAFTVFAATVKVENVPGGALEVYYENAANRRVYIPIGEQVTVPDGTSLRIYGTASHSPQGYRTKLRKIILTQNGIDSEVTLLSNVTASGDMVFKPGFYAVKRDASQTEDSHLYFDGNDLSMFISSIPAAGTTYQLYRNENQSYAGSAAVSSVSYEDLTGTYQTVGTSLFTIENGNLKVNGTLQAGSYTIEYADDAASHVKHGSLYVQTACYDVRVRTPFVKIKNNVIYNYSSADNYYAEGTALSSTGIANKYREIAGYSLANITVDKAGGQVLGTQTVTQSLADKYGNIMVTANLSGYTPAVIAAPTELYDKLGWTKNTDGRWSFINDDGTTLKNSLKDGDAGIGSGTYYLGADGYVVTGSFQLISSNTYYFDENGRMVKGKSMPIKADDGKFYLYTFDASGIMQTSGTVSYGGAVYNVASDGKGTLAANSSAIAYATPSTPNNAAKTAANNMQGAKNADNKTAENLDAAKAYLDGIADMVIAPIRAAVVANGGELEVSFTDTNTANELTRIYTIIHRHGGNEFKETLTLRIPFKQRADVIRPATPSTPSNSGRGGGSGSGTVSTKASAGWVKDAKGWWYRNADGSYPRNQWARLSSSTGAHWYRFNDEGYMSRGWYLDTDGVWYFLSKDEGSMQTGWHHDADDGRWYWLDMASGAMQLNWNMINGSWYYFNYLAPKQTWVWNASTKMWDYTGNSYRPFGSMYINEATPDRFRVDSSGAWIQ